MSTWILLRGLTREKRHWHSFPGLFAEAHSSAQVITLELPGNGILNDMTSPADIAGMASHCRSELARLDIPPPYNLLAMSMGAMVATAWASSQPEEVGACVLINTSFRTFSPLYHRLRPRAWMYLLRFLATRSVLKREQIIFDLTTRLVNPAGPLVEAWVSIRRSRSVRTWNAFRQLLASARFKPPLVVPVATLILVGAEDRLVDPRCSMEIARRWKCAIAVHPGAGHDLPLDDGPWVIEAVQDWLRREAIEAKSL